MHKLFVGFVVFAVGIVGTSAAYSAGLEIALTPSDQNGADATISYSLINQSTSTVHVLRWQTPLDGVTNDLFDVRQNGKPVDYVGPLYKRVAPRAQDFIELKPGESLNAVVDLSAFYDMRAGGQYQVSYARSASEVIREVMQAERGGVAAGLGAFDLSRGSTSVFADATPGALDMDSEESRTPVIPLAASNSFISCSNTRQTQLATARNSSVTYASNSKSYLTAGTTGSRYTWWFGTYNSSRYSTVRTHFNNIYSALSSQAYTFNCSCSDSGTYAYVYPTQPYKVYLCGAFWSAPNTGTDSRAGTLVHETSHFNVVASTKDNAYGQTAAHNLALSNPAKAVANADSHEYFAENTPARN
ncbi:M35 family metallo-endopeptidase [Dokdonella immobilis]|uniref:Peptidyl-Lys metalloendopeptidase n=1 Tax=Dokdonella immobilis TaxID=578942 RepID=A0A1I4XJH2_9GAMM|nr:M35 family metallo-endopeptidase [Dokdonella immobilis]SFN26004.1 peptidyl-Lys metalloendopeptidase [Dokdonella immobilis]